MFKTLPATALALLSALPGPSAAQTLPPYRSALEDYKPFVDEKTAPWTQSNDTVGRIGGWRAYAKEAQEGASAPARPTAPASAASAPRAAASSAMPAHGHGKH